PCAMRAWGLLLSGPGCSGSRLPPAASGGPASLAPSPPADHRTLRRNEFIALAELHHLPFAFMHEPVLEVANGEDLAQVVVPALDRGVDGDVGPDAIAPR